MSTPTAIRVWETEWAIYRKFWRSHALLAFVQPLLYLLGMGLGVGALVDENAASTSALDGLTYFEFLAPALLATTAMISLGQSSLWPVLDGFIWGHRYTAMAATPLTPGEVAAGVTLAHTTRGAIGVTGVALVLACFDDTRSWGLLVAVPAAVLTGLAYALPLTAWSSTRTGGSSFPAIIRFGLLPMFLFGGAFFPIDQLPDWLQPVAVITPLWHGVEICRAAVVDVDVGSMPVHLAVLVAYAVAGWFGCRKAFTRRLHT